jgi:hypothetical protein
MVGVLSAVTAAAGVTVYKDNELRVWSQKVYDSQIQVGNAVCGVDIAVTSSPTSRLNLSTDPRYAPLPGCLSRTRQMGDSGRARGWVPPPQPPASE